jgi:hypothetical protein
MCRATMGHNRLSLRVTSPRTASVVRLAFHALIIAAHALASGAATRIARRLTLNEQQLCIPAPYRTAATNSRHGNFCRADSPAGSRSSNSPATIARTQSLSRASATPARNQYMDQIWESGIRDNKFNEISQANRQHPNPTKRGGRLSSTLPANRRPTPLGGSDATVPTSPPGYGSARVFSEAHSLHALLLWPQRCQAPALYVCWMNLA